MIIIGLVKIILIIINNNNTGNQRYKNMVIQ